MAKLQFLLFKTFEMNFFSVCKFVVIGAQFVTLLFKKRRDGACTVSTGECDE